MSYSKNIKWEIVPKTLPTVKRYCSKCGNNAVYINSRKFRVNANKNYLDVWLIYQCKQCKSTWNLPIYERINIKEMDLVQYNLFLNNDSELAIQYGFDKAIHKDKVNLEFENIEYEIVGDEIPLYKIGFNKKDRFIVDISCKYSFDLRLDKVISKKLSISREEVKKLYKNSVIWSDDGGDNSKKKLKAAMRIFIGMAEE